MEEYQITPAALDAYEQAVGRKVAWVYFSNDWFASRAFPLATAQWIRSRNAVPFIRLMLRSSSETYVAEPLYSLEAILRGDFDSDLKAWGQAAKAFGTPVLVEWGTEVNGQWFSWNGRWNGGPTLGPQRFRDTYRHIVQTIKSVGADNLTWVWHVDAYDDPEAEWNRLENYYPGHDVVDWIGVSVYGAQEPAENNTQTFADGMNSVMPRLARLAPDKPVVVAEFAVTAGNPRVNAVQWAEAALSGILSNQWPQLRGFAWWNEAFDTTEMRVQVIPGLKEVFRQKLASPQVLDRPL
ncbi:glycoside hydrolase family 26 protein [Meiothermus cerbereus]|uniref:glycoside hydrolase family 26 protein n=1 Tax=Meiothermus cerbereus TaxID=65552 RepID=UPI000B187FD7|nr:glycosyl hydrolase [Meiothermus cerbereus]